MYTQHTGYTINNKYRKKFGTDSTTEGTMRCILITCILLSGGFGCRAQLNYEGNPLTETIDYTAQESKATRLNAQQNYQRFEVTDGRMINLSKIPLTPSVVDPLTTGETGNSSPINNADTKYDERTKKSTRQTALADNDSFLPEPDQRLRAFAIPVGASASTTIVKPPIDDSSTGLPAHPAIAGSRTEARQSHEYPIQSAAHQSYQPAPQTYAPIKENLAAHLQNQINKVSDQALDRFLNSRTPEESEMALQSYLAARAREENARHNIEQKEIFRRTFDNEQPTNRESSQQIDDVLTLPIKGTSDFTSKLTYSPQGLTQFQLQPHQHYPALKWNQMTTQLRREGFHSGPSMMRPRPMYRGPMKPRMSPWAQSRIAPGPPVYRPKESTYGGRPLSPAINGHWKQPIELIYTKPPGLIASDQIVLGDAPVPHQDASKWLYESDHPPSPAQKDVYYSQLYAQSYDPHYYNYIAKTGKIKPWLYGKLGKTEEKSIWWELFTGFKNHGMKNMMNPMFLLGMSIPTLTFVLSALIQKRSAARANTNGYYPRDFVDKYESQIREAISSYEERTKETTGLDPSENRKIQKRSIGPSPPGVYPFEEYFLTHQDKFAAAILAYDRELTRRMESDEKTEKTQARSANSMARGSHIKQEEIRQDEQRADQI